MHSKTFNEYKTGLELLKNNSFLLGHKLSPEFLMCDFEKPLRQATKEVFPSATILGCEFHFCRAIWKSAARFGLKK